MKYVLSQPVLETCKCIFVYAIEFSFEFVTSPPVPCFYKQIIVLGPGFVPFSSILNTYSLCYKAEKIDCCGRLYLHKLLRSEILDLSAGLKFFLEYLERLFTFSLLHFRVKCAFFFYCSTFI